MNEEIDLSKDGDDAMFHFEGNVLHVYFDQAHKETIGKGHLCTQYELDTGRFCGGAVQATRDAQGRWAITAEQSNTIFRADLHRFVVDLRRLYKGPRLLKPNEADAIILWDFNTGGLVMAEGKNSGVLDALNEGRFADVPGQMMRWNHIRDRRTGALVESPDLTARRKAEINIFVYGYGHPDTEREVRAAANECYAKRFTLLELVPYRSAIDTEPDGDEAA